MKTLRSQIDEKIQQKHMLAHPFYLRWQDGKLTLPELQGYAKEYYQFEAEFPRFLSSVHSHLESREMRTAILANLVDEEQGKENHVELWLRFAEGLGVNREDVKSHFYSDETQHLVRTYRKFCQAADPIEGLSALYAYEKQQPDVARTKAEGLQKYYGLKDEHSVSFFKAHEVVDVYHAESEVDCLESLCVTSELQSKATKVAEETLSTLYDFLDGIQRRYSPE